MSSTIDYNTYTPAQLLAARSQIDEIIGSLGAAAGKQQKSKKPKRVGSSGPWADWTKKIMTDNAKEITAYKEAADKKAGAHLKWISENKGKTSAEWLAYKIEWAAAHPKDAKSVASVEGSDAESVEAAPAAAAEKKKRGPKKLADMNAEERAAHDAKVAERKAKKAEGGAEEKKAKSAVPIAPSAVVFETVAAPVVAAPAPVEEAAESQAEEDEIEMKHFLLDGKKYVRPWSVSVNDWATNDLWYTKKTGERGAYWGELMEDGSVNADAEEPQFD